MILETVPLYYTLAQNQNQNARMWEKPELDSYYSEEGSLVKRRLRIRIRIVSARCATLLFSYIQGDMFLRSMLFAVVLSPGLVAAAPSFVIHNDQARPLSLRNHFLRRLSCWHEVTLSSLSNLAVCEGWHPDGASGGVHSLLSSSNGVLGGSAGSSSGHGSQCNPNVVPPQPHALSLSLQTV